MSEPEAPRGRWSALAADGDWYSAEQAASGLGFEPEVLERYLKAYDDLLLPLVALTGDGRAVLSHEAIAVLQGLREMEAHGLPADRIREWLVNVRRLAYLSGAGLERPAIALGYGAVEEAAAAANEAAVDGGPPSRGAGKSGVTSGQAGRTGRRRRAAERRPRRGAAGRWTRVVTGAALLLLALAMLYLQWADRPAASLFHFPIRVALGNHWASSDVPNPRGGN